jgi:hypothetical protein
MDSSNNFKDMSPNFKETYFKKKRFKKLKGAMSKKATAQLEASEDPMGYLDKMSNPNIKGLKGIAF